MAGTFKYEEFKQRLDVKLPMIDTEISLKNDDDGDDAAFDLIRTRVFPHWAVAGADIQARRCTDGITNKLIHFTRTPTEESVLLRCYGSGTSHLINRTHELTHHYILSLPPLGYAPPLYARFRNGFVYGFVSGRVLKPPELSESVTSARVAELLGEWHRRIRIDYTTTENKSTASNMHEPALWQTLRQWLAQVPQSYSSQASNDTFSARQDILSPVVLAAEIEQMDKWIHHRCRSDIVFCHNDLLAANIIYHPASESSMGMDEGKAISVEDMTQLNNLITEETSDVDSGLSTPTSEHPISHLTSPFKSTHSSASKHISFIDYEYASLNPRGFDIANHFNEYAGFECDYTLYPSSAHQHHFFRHYLSSYTAHPSHSHSDHHDQQQQMEALEKEVKMYRPMSHLYWGIWALVQANVSTIDFDYLGYAVLRIEEYFKTKRELMMEFE